MENEKWKMKNEKLLKVFDIETGTVFMGIQRMVSYDYGLGVIST